jgi:hypothetical protein
MSVLCVHINTHSYVASEVFMTEDMCYLKVRMQHGVIAQKPVT